jgi:phosphate transport system permease protein
MASLIANEFSEASSNVYLASLIEIALLLFIISTLINIAGKIVVNRMAAG